MQRLAHIYGRSDLFSFFFWSINTEEKLAVSLKSAHSREVTAYDLIMQHNQRQLWQKHRVLRNVDFVPCLQQFQTSRCASLSGSNHFNLLHIVDYQPMYPAEGSRLLPFEVSVFVFTGSLKGASQFLTSFRLSTILSLPGPSLAEHGDNY